MTAVWTKAWPALLLGGMLAAAAQAAPREVVCSVSAVQGPAQWQPPGGKLTGLKAGQGLEVGSELRTGAKARVRLRCVDGSTLVLADSSRLQIELFEPAAAGAPRLASFMLNVGLLGQKVQPQEGGRWQVRTPSAVTAVRGTEFMVEVAADLSTAVHVLSGAVAVEAQDEASAAAASAAGGAEYISKSILTRGLRPPAAVLLEAAGARTRCAPGGGCRPADTGPAAELRKLRGRLGNL